MGVTMDSNDQVSSGDLRQSDTSAVATFDNFKSRIVAELEREVAAGGGDQGFGHAGHSKYHYSKISS
jgi:hypothetical protein